MSTAQPMFDVAVIGAGLVGAASAWRLAEQGLRVLVLEREPAPASGSTGRSAAGIRLQFSDEANLRLSAASLAEYREMPAAAYRPIGYLFLVPQADWPTHREAALRQQAFGAPVQLLSVDQAQHIVPCQPDDLAGATWCAVDGVIDPHGACLSFVERARALGVRWQMRSAVEAIDRVAHGWSLRAGGQTFHAARIVNAAGAWAGQVAAMAGLEAPVQPARRIVFTSSPLPPALRRAQPYPLTVDLATGFYFRSEGERLIFGQSNPDDVGFEEGIDWPWLDTVAQSALGRFPWFEAVGVDRRACWWGYYEVTPDHQAIIGHPPGEERWVHACGFSGHGVQQAPAVGRLVSELVTGRTPFVDLAPFRPDRFAAGSVSSSAERLIV